MGASQETILPNMGRKNSTAAAKAKRRFDMRVEKRKADKIDEKARKDAARKMQEGLDKLKKKQ